VGASVRVFSADAADDARTADMLHAIRTGMPPLAGVFHLAAAFDGALLNDIEPERLDLVMRPKAVAGWTLHRHLEGEQLDFFVLFSSIAAAISQPGLGSYAAANAYVDALARYRRAKGLKAQSIQWGAWLSTGLANDEQVQRGVQLYRRQGVRPLAVEAALNALGRIMMLDRTGVLALPVSWEQFAGGFENAEAPRAFLQLLPKSEAKASPAPVESIREKLLSAGIGRQRRDALEAHLREKLAAVLKTDTARIDPVKPFGSMGVGSLMALEFVRRLAVTTSLRLPATAVFNYPTIRALAREISRRMEIPLDGEGPSGRAPAAPETRGAVSAPIAFTDEEAIRLLTAKGDRQR